MANLKKGTQVGKVGYSTRGYCETSVRRASEGSAHYLANSNAQYRFIPVYMRKRPWERISDTSKVTQLVPGKAATSPPELLASGK